MKFEEGNFGLFMNSTLKYRLTQFQLDRDSFLSPQQYITWQSLVGIGLNCSIVFLSSALFDDRNEL